MNKLEFSVGCAAVLLNALWMGCVIFVVVHFVLRFW